MINNKKKKQKKPKKIPEYRNKLERSYEVKLILFQLNHFHLNMTYKPIQLLYTLFKKYINDAERIIVNIPFPEINRRIQGILPTNKNEYPSIALIQEYF